MRHAIQGLVVATTALGIAVSASGCSAAVPEVEYVFKTETVTIPPPPPETVTVTQPPEKLPQVCLDVQKYAREIDDLSADIERLSSDISEAAFEVPKAAYSRDFKIINEQNQIIVDRERELENLVVKLMSARISLDKYSNQCNEATKNG